MFQDFLIPFIAIGLAELGDKTQLAILCLSSQTKKHIQLFLGIALAFIFADGIAVMIGSFMPGIIPADLIKILAGIVFILFGIIQLTKKGEEKTRCELKSPFLSAFLLVFVSEMGDKTQIASALFAAEYNPILVFSGVIHALLALSIIAIYVGNIIMKKINKRTVSIVSGIIFIIIGILSFF